MGILGSENILVFFWLNSKSANSSFAASSNNYFGFSD